MCVVVCNGCAPQAKLSFLAALLGVSDREVGSLVLKLPTILTLSMDRMGQVRGEEGGGGGGEL